MIVVKAGGGEGLDMEAVCADVAELVRQGERVVLVHGGSHETNVISEKLGHPPRFVTSVSGHVSRHTDRETLEIFAMVTAGRINKLLVERLQQLGVNAVGLSGLDGRLLEGKRKSALRIVENGKRKVLRGEYSGKIERVNVELLRTLLEAGYTPVVAPLAISYESEALNVDGDRAAAAIGSALKAQTVVILTNVPGLLRDFADESTLIPHIPLEKAEEHLDRYAQGRMKRKLLGAIEALRDGVGQVVIADGRVGQPLRRALAGQGTVIGQVGNQSSEIIGLEDRHDSGLYHKQPLVLVRGEGARVWDADGREYIDCVGGHGVANVGHANPAVIQAVTEQVRRLVICPNGFYNDQRAQLLAELTRVAPPGLERAFLCNSGTEAVEAALKFARLATCRTKVVAAMRGFHGRTFGALSATWRKVYRQPFEPLVPGFGFVPYNRLARMEQAVDEETAAVILEVVQGEGGVIPGDPEYLRGVQSLCRERGALFIVDEVQTGFGRTGRMFACEHHDLQPDLMCVAKGIAGGLPMGGVLIGLRVGDLPKKAHGSTLGGNPLACAAALAAIRYTEAEHLPQRAAKLGARLIAGLKAIPSPRIRQVRGLGLMVGVELKDKSGPYLAGLAERGVLALAAGATVMRFLPPLVISAEDVDVVIERVAAVLEA